MKRDPLAGDLAAEQRAFLRRDRAGWADHLVRARTFLGEGLRSGRPEAPVLVLGPGSGLEVPWALAPASAVGWDADPWSRMWTLLRHRRWRPWVFRDLTGGLGELAATARRAARQPWSGRARPVDLGARRLAGLIGFLAPEAAPLRDWIARHRPSTILAANVMGQFGAVAHRLVEAEFPGGAPWNPDPEAPDPLAEALDAWTARAVRAFLGVLLASGADLWLLHDRGVVFGATPWTLDPDLRDPWTAQLQADRPLEAADPLCGVDVVSEINGRFLERHQRWIWRLAPDQAHVMEAMRIPPAPAFLGHNPT